MISKVILSLVFILIGGAFLPTSVLGIDTSSPRGSRSCQPAVFYDSRLTPLTDKNDKSLNRLVDSRELVLRELKTNFTTDLDCSGIEVYSTFDLVLQHKVAQQLLSFAASHPEIKDGAVLVCNSTGNYWQAAAAIKEEMTNLIKFEEEIAYLCAGNTTIAQINSADGKILFEKTFGDSTTTHLPYHFLTTNKEGSNLTVIPAKTDKLFLISLQVDKTSQTNIGTLGRDLVFSLENLFLEGGEK